MGRSTVSVRTRPAILFGEIMAVLGILNSRLGIAGIGLILLLCAWGWHMASTSILELEIAGLKKDIVKNLGR